MLISVRGLTLTFSCLTSLVPMSTKFVRGRERIDLCKEMMIGSHEMRGVMSLVLDGSNSPLTICYAVFILY